jgi:hypothetical protein
MGWGGIGRELGKGGEMTLTLYAHMNKKKVKIKINLKNFKKRKCSIYSQWTFTQSQRRMKFYFSQVVGWNWRTTS